MTQKYLYTVVFILGFGDAMLGGENNYIFLLYTVLKKLGKRPKTTKNHLQKWH